MECLVAILLSLCVINDELGYFYPKNILHDYQLIIKPITFDDETMPLRKNSQHLMQVFKDDFVKDGLSFLESIVFDKSVAFYKVVS